MWMEFLGRRWSVVSDDDSVYILNAGVLINNGRVLGLGKNRRKFLQGHPEGLVASAVQMAVATAADSAVNTASVSADELASALQEIYPGATVAAASQTTCAIAAAAARIPDGLATRLVTSELAPVLTAEQLTDLLCDNEDGKLWEVIVGGSESTRTISTEMLLASRDVPYGVRQLLQLAGAKIKRASKQRFRTPVQTG